MLCWCVGEVWGSVGGFCVCRCVLLFLVLWFLLSWKIQGNRYICGSFKLNFMKNKFAILFCTAMAVFLGSCGVKTPYFEYAVFADYRLLAEKGFFVTEAESVSFDYETIGFMSVQVSSGYRSITKDGKPGEKKVGLLEEKTEEYKKATLPDALEYFREKAVSTGANGAIRMDIMVTKKPVVVGGVTVYEPDGYVVSGMLIKK